jgi:hypothetical protein
MTAKAGAGPFYASCGWIEVGRAKYRNTPLVYFEHLLVAFVTKHLALEKIVV